MSVEACQVKCVELVLPEYKSSICSDDSVVFREGLVSGSRGELRRAVQDRRDRTAGIHRKIMGLLDFMLESMAVKPSTGNFQFVETV